jgi:hypothetical protein
MREPNLGTVQFSVGNPGEIRTLEELTRYVRDIESRAAAAITLLAAGHLDVINTAPTKPRQGDIRYADGTNFNPGGGEGIYFYNSGGIWKQLG